MYMYMQQCHLQQVSCRDICVTACKILLLLYCIWTWYVLRSDYLMLILQIYTITVRLHDVTSFLNHKTILSKHVLIFLPWKYDIISQLCHSYAKDPFCVTRLIYTLTVNSDTNLTNREDLKGIHTDLGVEDFQFTVTRIHHKHYTINCKHRRCYRIQSHV